MFLDKLTSDGRTIVKNFSYLSLMRFFNIGIKFLLVAYLVRVLGEKNYGLVTWLDSVIQYFLMLINFGFNIYAAKYIVDLNGKKKELNQIVSAIFIIKGLLFVFSLIAVFAISFSRDFNPHQSLFLLFMCSGIGEVLFPIWFFQGKENLKPATFIVFFSRIILLIGVFVLVKSTDDVIVYVALLFVSSFVMGILGAFYVFRHCEIQFVHVGLKELWLYVRESTPFFLGRFLSLVFNFGTIFLIGKYCELEQVSGFDICLKIIMVGVIPFEMLQQAVFPSLARTKDKDLLRKLLTTSFILGSIIGVVIFVFAEQLLLLFGGGGMVYFFSTLEILAISAPFIACTFILGSCGLVAFGHFREYNFSLIATSIIYVSLLIILYVFDELSFWNLIYLRVFGDVLMCLLRTYFILKRGILKLITA